MVFTTAKEQVVVKVPRYFKILHIFLSTSYSHK
jgi:hypothetical protein